MAIDNYPLYLVSAELENGKIVPGTVAPLRFNNIAVKGVTIQESGEEGKKYKISASQYSFCKTDKFGLMCMLDDKGDKMISYVKSMPNAKKTFQFIQQQAIEASIYLSNDEAPEDTWKKRLSSLLQNELKPETEVSFNTFLFTKSDISKDFFNGLSSTEQKELDLFFSARKEFLGLVLPIKRHLLILLPTGINKISLTSPFRLINAQDIKNLELPFNLPGVQVAPEINSAVISLPKEQLPSGVYTLTAYDTAANYIDPDTGTKSTEYTLSFKADFAMPSPLGPMDIINGFPVTLEETLLMHYPAEYEHLTSALKSYTKFGEENKDPIAQAKKTFEKSIEVAKVLKEKNDFIKKRVENVKKHFLDDAIDVIGRECPEIKSAYELAKNSIKCKKKVETICTTWKLNTKLFNIIDASTDLTAAKKFFFCAMGANVYNTYGDEVFRHVLTKNVDGIQSSLSILSSKDDLAKYELLLETDGLHKKILETQKSAYAKTLEGIDLVFSAYDTLMAFSSMWELSVNSDEEQKKYSRLMKEVAKLNLVSGSRDMTATVVKSRIGVDAMAQGVKAAKVQAMWGAFNLGCSILSLTPVAPAVNAIKFVIGTGSAIKLTFISVADQVGQIFPQNIVNQVWKKLKVSKRLHTDMSTNYSLLTKRSILDSLPDDRTKDIYVQSRIYAEAIRGLMALIQGASCRMYYKSKTGGVDTTEFDRNITEADVEGYVNRFINKGGWLIPQNALPVGLDTIWNYMYWENKSGTYQTACASGNVSISSDRYNSAQYYGASPNNMTSIPPAHWKADFKKYFPIQKIESPDIKTVGRIFSLNYTGAEEFIRWSQIYYRKKPTDENTGINDGWEPLNTAAISSSVLTTNIQIRIVVVFDKADIRAVPMSLRLNRVEPLKDIYGPEYKFIPSTLSVQDGGLIKGEELYKGKLGTVFFPFYMFGGEFNYGIRPLECELSAWGAIEKTFLAGKVDDINQYGFVLKIGDAKVPLFYGPNFVDYGSIDKKLLAIQKVFNAKEYFPAIGRHTFLFRLNKKILPDQNMLRSPTFLTTRSSEEEMPSLAYRNARSGVSGFYFHDGQTGEYHTMAKWDNKSGHNLITNFDKPSLLPQKYCQKHSLRMTVIVYITSVNDIEFVRTSGYIRSWTATPCKLNVNEAGILGKTKQVIPGTLHFLGYGTSIKSENDIGFKMRRIRTSVNLESVTVEDEKDTFEDIPETANFNEDLAALLKWGNQGSFNKDLFADPGLFWQSAFFAANFDLCWNNEGTIQKGLHKDFVTNSKIAFSLNACGKLLLKDNKAFIVPQFFAQA